MDNFALGTRSCLTDVPDPSVIFGPATCGNQILEQGEACDCGTPEMCTR